jgi:hypothetical protein
VPKGLGSFSARSEGHVLVEKDGAIVCQPMSEGEARRAAWQHLTVPVRRISAPFHFAQQPSGLKIVLRGTPQLDGFPQAKEAFLRAAATWESLIRLTMTVVIDVDFGPTRFGQPFGPNVLGATSQTTLAGPYSDARQRLLVGAAGMAERSVYELLPRSDVPTDNGTTSDVVATHSQLRALGILQPIADPDTEASTIGPPPRIGFNSAFAFDFNPADGIDSDKTDFDAVALHEIGHLLGFISQTGARELNPGNPVRLSLWDLFRFRPGVTMSSFATAERILSSGGDQVFFAGGREIPLSTGRPDGTGGDRQQASHWKDDALTGQFIGLMDPVIPRGQREVLTLNDLLALDFFGYRVKGIVFSSLAETTIDLPLDGSQPGMVESPPSPPDGVLAATQFRLRVPQGATQLTIALQASGNQDLDLYVRFGQRITLDGGRPVADYSAEYPQGNESLTLSASSFPALQPGDCFIAVANFGPGAATFTLTVTVRTDTVDLTSGVATTGSIPAPSSSGLGVLGTIQYRIAVPDRASHLKVELTTTGRADIDLFVRFGQRVAIEGGRVVADYRAETPSGNETIAITPLSSPPLRSGSYFIAVANFGPGAATFTLTATVTVIQPNTPDIEVKPTILDFGATPVNGRRERVLTVQNLGDGPLTVSSATLSNARFTVSSPMESFTVEPKTERPVIVRFSPLVSGLQTGTLTFVTNDPDEMTVTISLRGEGSTANTEELSTDDGTVESGARQDGAIVVNRLTPSKYPATLRTVRIFFARGAGLPSPSGAQIKLILFADPTESGRPPPNPTLLTDPITVTIPTIPSSGRFVDFALSGIPPIMSGDVYVGFQAPTPSGGIVFWADVDGPQQGRSFLSRDNGMSYGRALFVDQQGNRTPVNFPIRAVVSFPSATGLMEESLEEEGFAPSTDSPVGFPDLMVFEHEEGSDRPILSLSGERDSGDTATATESESEQPPHSRTEGGLPAGDRRVVGEAPDGESAPPSEANRPTDDGRPLFRLVQAVQPPPRMLTIPEVRAEPGQVVTIPILLSDGRGVSAIRMTVGYNPALLSLVEKEAVSPGTLVPEGFTLTATTSLPGQISLVIAPPVTQPVPSLRSGSGSIVRLVFRTEADAAPGATSTLAISKLSLADATSNAVNVVSQNGLLSVGPPVRVMTLPLVEGNPGTTVALPIHLSEGSTISALHMTVRFDPDLLAPVSNNPVAAGTLVPPRFSLVANTSVRGQVTVVIAPPIASPLPTFFSGSGTVATLTLRVATEAPDGAVSPLSLTTSASDSQGNAVLLRVQHGGFTVLAGQRGDVNRDGTINSQDLVRLILHLIGQQPLTGAALVNADLDNDGQITPQDLVLLVRLLAGIP